MQPRWHKVLRDLWNNKTRTMLVVLSIAVGVFAVGMIAGSAVILTEGLTMSYESLRPADVTFFTGEFEDPLVDAVRNMREVRDAEGRRNLTLRFKYGPAPAGAALAPATAENPAEWGTLQLVAVADYDDMRVSRVQRVTGEWPPPEHEMLIERTSLAFMKANVGDTILVEKPDGSRREVRIAGLARDLGQPNAILANQASAYVTRETLEWLGAPRNFNLLYVVAAGDNMNIENNQRVANLVRDKIESSGTPVIFNFVPPPGRLPASDFMNTLLVVLGLLGALSLGLSGFLVVNTVSALLTQQIRQIGIMKAIGGQDGQITVMYFAMVVIFGVLSLGLAIPLGGLAAYGLAQFMATFLNFDIGPFAISWEIIALQSVIGVLVPVLAALWPIIAGTRVTVREAISSYGIGQGHYGSGWLDRIMGQVRGVSRPMMLSLRNTFRRKARLLLTLITLTLASTTFVVVFSVRDSLLETLQGALDFWDYDVLVDFTNYERVSHLSHEARSVPGVASVEAMAFAGTRRVRPDTTESDNLIAIAVPATTDLIRPQLLEGRWLLSEDETAAVINTDVLRLEPDLKVGGSITLKLSGREYEWRIVGIVRGLGVAPYIFINYPYMAKTLGEMGRADQLLVRTTDESAEAQQRTAEALERHFKARGMDVEQTVSISVFRRQIEFFFNVIVAFLMIMAVLLGSVGGLGLMGTMSINVIERTREIGVMRAIGASDGIVFRIILVEGIFIGLLSWVMGTLLALPLSQVLSDAVGMALFQAPLAYTFSSGGALLWFGVVVVLAALASFLPAWNASRLTVREVLAYE